MIRSTHPAICAIPPDELFRAELFDVAEASRFSKKSRVELFALMNAGILPWRRGKKGCRTIPRRALEVLNQWEWEHSEEPELKVVPRPQKTA